MRFVRHRAKLDFMAFKTLIAVDSLRKLLGEPRSAVIACRFESQQASSFMYMQSQFAIVRAI